MLDEPGKAHMIKTNQGLSAKENSGPLLRSSGVGATMSGCLSGFCQETPFGDKNFINYHSQVKTLNEWLLI